MKRDDSSQPAPSPDLPDSKDFVALIVACLAIIAFSILVACLMSRVQDFDSVSWERVVYLMTGVEAIVFAATGFLFGREVHRGRAERAEHQADLAEARLAQLAELSLTTRSKFRAPAQGEE